MTCVDVHTPKNNPDIHFLELNFPLFELLKVLKLASNSIKRSLVKASKGYQLSGVSILKPKTEQDVVVQSAQFREKRSRLWWLHQPVLWYLPTYYSKHVYKIIKFIFCKKIQGSM